MIEHLIAIVKEAGEEILKIYNNKEVDVENKIDNSPVTKADFVSNQVIIRGLKKFSAYPILTEESLVSYTLRKGWKTFWLVDPLDGTKDFLEKNDMFCISIALISANRPILGLLYSPVTKDVWWAEKGKGSYKNGAKLSLDPVQYFERALVSVHHNNKKVEDWLCDREINELIAMGSALKFAAMAEGKADVYPRLYGSSEWDIAAGEILVQEAGCEMLDIEGKVLIYNKPSLRNPHFIVAVIAQGKK